MTKNNTSSTSNQGKEIQYNLKNLLFSPMETQSDTFKSSTVYDLKYSFQKRVAKAPRETK